MAHIKLTQEDRAKATRRPIPKTMQGWTAEVGGVERFCKQIIKSRDANGKAWLESMQNYYRMRLVILGENIPPGMPKTAARAIIDQALKGLNT